VWNVTELSISDGKKKIVRDLGWQLSKGEIYALMGPSGAGKTVATFSALGTPAGSNLKITCSSSLLGGQNLFSLSEKKRRLLVSKLTAIVPQNASACFHPLWPVKRVFFLFAQKFFPGLSKERIVAKIKRALKMAALAREGSSLLNKRSHELSGGLLKRLLLALAFFKEFEILILDEPFSDIDPSLKALIMPNVRQLIGGDKAAFFITHNLREVSAIADRVGFLFGGVLVQEAFVRELSNGCLHPYVYFLIKTWSGDRNLFKNKRLFERPGKDGCPFAPACPFRQKICLTTFPPVRKKGSGWIRCHKGPDVLPRLEAESAYS